MAIIHTFSLFLGVNSEVFAVMCDLCVAESHCGDFRVERSGIKHRNVSINWISKRSS